MNARPSCESCRALLDAWVDGELPETERSRVARHLESCADCRAEVAALVAVDAAIRRLPDGEPSGGYLERVADAVWDRATAGEAAESVRDAAAERGAGGGRWWRPGRRGPWWRSLAPVAALALVAVVGRELWLGRDAVAPRQPLLAERAVDATDAGERPEWTDPGAGADEVAGVRQEAARSDAAGGAARPVVEPPAGMRPPAAAGRDREAPTEAAPPELARSTAPANVAVAGKGMTHDEEAASALPAADESAPDEGAAPEMAAPDGGTSDRWGVVTSQYHGGRGAVAHEPETGAGDQDDAAAGALELHSVDATDASARAAPRLPTIDVQRGAESRLSVVTLGATGDTRAAYRIELQPVIAQLPPDSLNAGPDAEGPALSLARDLLLAGRLPAARAEIETLRGSTGSAPPAVRAAVGYLELVLVAEESRDDPSLETARARRDAAARFADAWPGEPVGQRAALWSAEIACRIALESGATKDCDAARARLDAAEITHRAAPPLLDHLGRLRAALDGC